MSGPHPYAEIAHRKRFDISIVSVFISGYNVKRWLAKAIGRTLA